MSSQDSLHLSPLTEHIVIGGTYIHYKNLPYKVIALAHHSETLEELVVYQALYGEGGLWVRPLKMFLETVQVDDKAVKRFDLNNSSFL